ncbi:MAG: glycoside hydrolase family 43 protein, partial [Treponema sp.]|nr:glycoside hydrolase family 43 protein [Treponema sp.]
MKNHIISKNRRLFAALASLAALIAGAAFVSCPSVNTEETVKYSITFDANGGKFSGDQDQITVISDTLRNVQAADFPDPQPTPPAQDLYFDNYYTGTDSGDIVSESTPLKPVSANFTVYARYTSSDSNLSADDAVALTKERLQIDAYMDYFYHEIILPSQGAEDTAISWTSNNAVYPVANGRVKVTDNTVFNGTITLTATISKGAIHDTKDFTVTIIDNNYYGYLLAYFNGNAVTQEQLRYALSTDGTDFVSLNDDNPVVLSATISTSGGIRDPHIVRGHDGKYYMVMTDMTSSRGWDSNRSIILLKSDDLLNWSASSVNISTRFSGFSTITHAWAPEIIYDRQKDKFLIYWSSNPNGGPDNIFYSWANSDFTDLTDDPVVLYPTSAPGVDPNSVIDGTLQNSGGKYRLFFKNQDGNFGTTNRICEATANTLTGQYGSARVNVTNDTVDGEGCETYRLIGTDTYVLAYDQYNNSTFGFFKSTDMASFTKASSSTNKTDGTHFVPRHGGFIPLTKAEYDFLAADRDWFAHAIPVVTVNAALGLHYDFANVTGSTVQDSAGANNGTLTASGGVTPTIVAASNGMKYMDTN